MRGNEMLEAVGFLDEALILRSETPKKRRSVLNILLRLGTAAACLLLIFGGVFLLNKEPEYIKPTRTIVKNYGYLEPMGMQIADVNNYEAVTELSSQIVLCKVNDLVEVEISQTGQFSFCYEIEILDTLLDVGVRLQIGDTVRVTSSEGILKATDAAALVADTARAKKFGILQENYAEEDYIVSSTWNAIPIEVGNCYLMYLNDVYLEKEGVYAESGRSYLYEYHGQTVYSGRDMIKNDLTLTEIINTVESYITMRTGRADEIGDDAYIDELGEKQQREKHPEVYIDLDRIAAIHQSLVINGISDMISAAPKYRDPELHTIETWDYEKLVDYLGLDIKRILSEFSRLYGLEDCGGEEFPVIFQKDGQLVEDISSFKAADEGGTEVCISASRLRAPYDCIYRADNEFTTTVPIPDTDETVDVMLYGNTDEMLYVADFMLNGVQYRITTKNLSTEPLAELLYMMVKTK
ncbi:MAG: hypothetical protein E7604_05505 [Ruminococcaceae bacterium]|nr:hypothetical protein [Oscillospiraceae bacterium]